MARLLLEAGRSLEAREALEEVLRTRPNFVDASRSAGAGALSLRRRARRAGHLEGVSEATSRERPGGGLFGDARPHRHVIRWALAAAVVACAACGGAADSERRGDEAYGRGQYAQALKEYRSLVGGKAHPRIWAKTGAAALRTGELREAADAYLHLAGEDPTRTQEAAEGLEAVARAAERADRPDALQQAVVGLQTVAPDRVPGPTPSFSPRRREPSPGSWSPCCPAPSPRRRTRPRWIRFSPSTPDCSSRLPGAARRCFSIAPCFAGPGSSLLAGARKGAADCALSLGQRSVTSGRDEDAALWFAEAARMDSSSATGRAALFAYGETRLNQGDTLAAALAFQAIVSDRSPIPLAERPGPGSPRWA